MMDIKDVLLLWFIVFLKKKKTSGGGFKSIPNQLQLGNELNKPIIRKFIKRKVYSSFKDNIWGADLAEM